jgi:hypothetical protein
MDDQATKKPRGKRTAKAPAEQTVYCRRLLRPLPLSEHKQCSYCFGEEGEIAEGDHEKFCDFDPAKDPINFGFPEGGGSFGRG